MDRMSARAVSLISSVFGTMSAKVNTIVDFLFGGSKGRDDSEERVAAAFEKSQAERAPASGL